MRTNLRREPRGDGADGGEPAGVPGHAERDATRTRIARELYDAVATGLNDVIVETVAAQQAIVREAHADDVLLRLRRAEDGAHAALADLRRLQIMMESLVSGTDQR
jgi:hypothetical protein